jgi:hypothetical protein
MTDAAAYLSTFGKIAPADAALITEIKPGMLDILRESARREVHSRIFNVFLSCSAFLLFISHDTFDAIQRLTALEANIAKVLLLVLLAYLAFGFAFFWPKRWARKVLLREVAFRRQRGSWRWEH